MLWFAREKHPASMKVYCCQLDMAWEDKPANFTKVRALVDNARPEPGSLVVLPEMFATGFSMNVAAVAEEKSPGTEAFLKELARQHNVFIIAGLVTIGPTGRGRNQAVVLSPDGVELTRYSKIHPFTLGGELANYERGTEIKFFEWQGVKATPFICYDLRFPEIFRTAVRGGTELFVVIADWPIRREQHWVTLLQARAIENLAYVVGVNRAGEDPQFKYPGRSLVVDPHGKVLADGGAEEGVFAAEIDPAVVRSWRKDFPALADIHWGIA
jgi:predicted amidohydrolase